MEGRRFVRSREPARFVRRPVLLLPPLDGFVQHHVGHHLPFWQSLKLPCCALPLGAGAAMSSWTDQAASSAAGTAGEQQNTLSHPHWVRFDIEW